MSQTIESLGNTHAGTIDIPAGCYLVSIIQGETAGNKALGGIKYGSALGLDNIIGSFNAEANMMDRVLIDGYKAPTKVYFDAIEDWNGASIDIHIVVESLTP